MPRLPSTLILAAWLGATAATAAFAGDTVTVEIKDYKFNPGSITIKAGETVRWINMEKRQYHNVWFEELGEPEPPYFFPEESYERTFTEPGEYPYRCGPHPEMRGAVTVVK